jgi:hypothetical protein
MRQINFQCDHCGNLMGVTEEFLGQEVRCPHCQQVVRAPAGEAPPAPDLPATLFAPPSPEPESIFTPPEVSDEDLFGGAAGARLELPPEPDWAPAPAPPPEPVWVPPPDPPPPEPAALPPPPPLEPTLTYVPPADVAAPETGPSGTEVPGGGPGDQGVTTVPEGAAESQPAAGTTAEPELPPVVSPAVARARRGGGWVVPVLIVPLILYSVLATIAVVYLISLLYLQPQRHPFEMLPDEGDHPGASHVRQKLQFHRTPLHDMPARLRVRLGQSLTIGDIKVTPLRAELRKIRCRTAGFAEPADSKGESLLVWLELQNVSRDVVFRPMDRYFNRHWQEKYEENMPFTYLEADGRRFYGGPELDDRQTVEGQDYDTLLGPGETMTTFVCTDPDAPGSPVARLLAGYRGTLLYRVRLRRGLIPFRGKEVSATAVIGVEFTGADVEVKPTPPG